MPDSEPMSDYQRNLLRRAEHRQKIAPPENVEMTPREESIRMVAESLAELNGWSLAYAIRQVRRVVGDEAEPFTAIEVLQYGYEGKDKPNESKYPQSNREERRRAKKLARDRRERDD